MGRFIVKAQVTQDLKIEIEADSLEEAQDIADQDLITDDFEVIHAVFTLGEIVEVEL